MGFWKSVGPLKQPRVLKWPGPLKHWWLLKCPRHTSSHWVGSSSHAISIEIVTQFQSRNLPKSRLFRLLSIKTSLITPKGRRDWRNCVEITLRLFLETFYSLERISLRKSLKCYTILDLSFKDCSLNLGFKTFIPSWWLKDLPGSNKRLLHHGRESSCRY